MDSGHGQHEIGFYHNKRGRQSFVAAVAENPNPASCAVRPAPPHSRLFFEGRVTTKKCRNHVTIMRRGDGGLHSYVEPQKLPGPAPIGALREPHGGLAELRPRCDARQGRSRDNNMGLKTNFCFTLRDYRSVYPRLRSGNSGPGTPLLCV